MKSWLGVLGRSCLEFLLLAGMIALVAGAQADLAAGSPSPATLMIRLRSSILDALPAALAAAIFLSIFSFESRLPSRLAGWLGSILLGLVLAAASFAWVRLPDLRALATTRQGPVGGPSLQAPGIAVDRDGVALWYRALEGGAARDAVAADFRADRPRLSHEAQAAPRMPGPTLSIGGTAYPAATPAPPFPAVLPEASYFAGFWIWDRAARLDDAPLLEAAAVWAGFVLLAAGFRFLARLSPWPLANAFFGSAGLVGLLVLDAALASPGAMAAAAPLLRAARLGGLSPALALAAAEALLGLVLAAADLVAAPGRRGRG